MPFVHTVITFRKPADTAELGEMLVRLEALPGLASSGPGVTSDYLDNFRVGDDVSVSLNSSTGKENKIHTSLVVGLIEQAGGTAKISSAVIVEPTDKAEPESVGRAMFSRVQMWGRVNRVGQQQNPQTVDVSELKAAASPENGKPTIMTYANLFPVSDAVGAWLEGQADGVFFDEETVAKPVEPSTPAPKM